MLKPIAKMPKIANFWSRSSGAHEQDYDGDQVNDDLVDAGQNGFDFVHGREALQNAEREARRDRTAQRSHAADDDYHKAEDEEVHAHVIIGAENGRVHDAGKARDNSCDAENNGKAFVDIYTEKSDGFAIGHARAHDHAECRKPQERENRADQDNRKQEIDEAPRRIHDVACIDADQCAEIDHPPRDIRCRLGNGIRTEIAFDDLLQHDCKAECHKYLFCMGPLVEVAYQAALHCHADKKHDRDGNQD